MIFLLISDRLRPQSENQHVDLKSLILPVFHRVAATKPYSNSHISTSLLKLLLKPKWHKTHNATFTSFPITPLYTPGVPRWELVFLCLVLFLLLLVFEDLSVKYSCRKRTRAWLTSADKIWNGSEWDLLNYTQVMTRRRYELSVTDWAVHHVMPSVLYSWDQTLLTVPNVRSFL